MEPKKWHTGTLSIHGGQKPGPSGERVVPIAQTTSFVFKDTEHAAKLFALEEFGQIYTRIGNPTTDVLEARLAELDGGVAGLCFSSGMAAITAAILTITSAGQHIVSSSSLYGGTVTLFTHTLKRLGIESTLVDSGKPEDFKRAIKDNTRLIYIESVGNPKNDVPDFEVIAKIAHDAGIPLICDNTVLTPAIFKPFDYGVDLAVYSCTKFIGGHGTSIGGAIIESGNFDWSSGKFPELTEPDESYHGVQYAERFGKLAFIVKARTQILRDMGGCMSPFNSWLFLQGLETLELRVARHSSNAIELASWLKGHSGVSWVNYVGLEEHPSYPLAKRYFKGGFGSVFGFGVKGGFEAGRRFIESVELCSHLANIGDSKTLVIHPASTTHQQLSRSEQEAAGVSEDFIRISVGTEDIRDIISDIDQAIKKSGE